MLYEVITVSTARCWLSAVVTTVTTLPPGSWITLIPTVTEPVTFWLTAFAVAPATKLPVLKSKVLIQPVPPATQESVEGTLEGTTSVPSCSWMSVITSYSIHYTKLYDGGRRACTA